MRITSLRTEPKSYRFNSCHCVIGFFSSSWLLKGIYGLGIYVCKCPLSLSCIISSEGACTLLTASQGRNDNCAEPLCGPEYFFHYGTLVCKFLLAVDVNSRKKENTYFHSKLMKQIMQGLVLWEMVLVGSFLKHLWESNPLSILRILTAIDLQL